MKKGIGIAVVFLGCVISAVDISRMFNGLAYDWGSILVGLLIALAGWRFLLESDHSLLLNAAKAVGCIAVITVILQLTGGNSTAPASQYGSTNVPHNSSANYAYYDDMDFGDNVYEKRVCFYCYGSGLCDTCGGSGRYEYTASSFRGDVCPTCGGSGRCHGCYGSGVR